MKIREARSVRAMVHALLTGLLLAAIPVGAFAQACPPMGPYYSQHDRFGINVINDFGKSVGNYNALQLKAGWYLDYQMETGPTQGMSYLRVIRPSTLGPNWQGDLGPIIDGNRGGVWQVGSEPDRFGQDPQTPEQYAAWYQQIHSFIKGRDPTATVLLGPIVQPTPIRLKYLDLVLQAYSQQNDKPLPTDGIAVHSFILPETESWGAGMPPGVEEDTNHQAAEYTLKDLGDVQIFKDRIADMRQWMKDNGYRGLPLLITEYGILLGPGVDYTSDTPEDDCTEPDGCYFDLPFVTSYMTQTFDYLLTAVNAQTGNPNDGNRLVQAWSWYSLNDFLHSYMYCWTGLNGSLLDHNTGLFASKYEIACQGIPVPPEEEEDVILLGPAYSGYITDKNLYSTYTDLRVDQFTVSPSTVLGAPDSPGTITLKLTMSNRGNVASLASNTIVRFYDGPLASGVLIAQVSPSSNIPARCGGSRTVQYAWKPGPLSLGTHFIYAYISSAGDADLGLDNNVAIAILTAAEPTPTPTFTPTPTHTATLRPGETRTPTHTPTFTLTPTNTPTLRPGETRTPTLTPTMTGTPGTPTPSVTPTPPDPFSRVYLPELDR